MKTYAYVDGFNLYYRALKDTPYRWLDLRALLASVLDSANKLEVIRYYTADVSGRVDADAPMRQQTYLRALKTIAGLTIHKGKFLAFPRWMPISDPPEYFVKPAPEVVCVIRTEEKGSDVNLASHLLRDGFRGLYDVAVVVSNDTDLVEPMRIVKEELKKPVGLICPSPLASASLKKVATFVRHLSVGRLHAAQFPPVIATKRGPIMRPPRWKL